MKISDNSSKHEVLIKQYLHYPGHTQVYAVMEHVPVIKPDLVTDCLSKSLAPL